MPTFIKTGFWEKAEKGFKGWLNLDQLINSIGSPTWGSINGVLSNQTDLQDALDDKVDLSALNSREVNGFPLSSDVVIPTIDHFRVDGAGVYYSTIRVGTVGTQTRSVDTLVAWPWFIEKAASINSFIAEVTGTAADSNFRFAIYTDNGSNYPDQLVANSDSGNQSSATTGVRTYTPSSNVSLAAGTMYWIAFNASDSIAMRSWTPASLPLFLGISSGMGANLQQVGLTVAQAFGAMPSTFPVGASVLTAGTGGCPIIGFRTV